MVCEVMLIVVEVSVDRNSLDKMKSIKNSVWKWNVLWTVNHIWRWGFMFLGN